MFKPYTNTSGEENVFVFLAQWVHSALLFYASASTKFFCIPLRHKKVSQKMILSRSKR